MLPLFARIWNMRSLCGTHISARISMRWSQFRGSLLKSVYTKCWSMHYQVRLDRLHLDTLRGRRLYIKQCHLYKLLHGLSIFPNCPITSSHSQPYHTRFKHNLSLHVPSTHTNAYHYSFFCDAPRTWNLLPHSVTSLPSLSQFKRSVSNFT